MLNRPNTSTRQRIQEQMERMRPSFTLMYCSQDAKEPPISFKYEQRIFKLPPMQKVIISDVVGVPPGKAYDYSLGPSQPRPWRTKDTGRGPKERVTIAAAEKVVAHGVGLLWKRGVVMLTGAKSDMEEIERGSAMWRQDRQHRDEVIVGAFHKRLEDFIADPRNKHLSRPLMGRLEREAQTRLDSFRLQDSGVPVDTEFRCQAEDCSYWSMDASELKQHAQAAHGGEVILTGATAEVEKALEEREQKRQTKRAADLQAKRALLEAEAKEQPPAILGAVEAEV